ncbi:MAG: MFS transporter [Hyphomicrobiaceae bacterium]|nr:MFS transporter [Hyphomicrobiaceae bacterium]
MTSQSTPATSPRPAGESAGVTAADRSFPLGPLLTTLAVQTLSTAAAYSIPAVAPAVAADLAVNPGLIGFFISTVYGVGILSALLSPPVIARRGAVAVSQAVLVATVVMLATAATGTLAAVAASAMLMGLAYGATAPASTHLLVPRTSPAYMNLVLSIRQIGVPLGGMLASLVMPPLTLRWGWQAVLLAQLVPVVVLGIAMQILCRHWDAARTYDPAAKKPSLLAPLAMLKTSSPLRRLSLVAFIYSGMQLCFMVFMTTQLTTKAGFDLVRAGQALAAYQLAGVISRPIWGWLSDRVMGARWWLGLQGIISCAAAIAAGTFSTAWPQPLVFVVCMIAGATASGFTGIAYGEYARLGGTRRTEATGMGAACMFAGVMVLPSVVSVVVTMTGSYERAYATIGLLALVAGLGMIVAWREPVSPERP